MYPSTIFLSLFSQTLCGYGNGGRNSDAFCAGKFGSADFSFARAFVPGRDALERADHMSTAQSMGISRLYSRPTSNRCREML